LDDGGILRQIPHVIKETARGTSERKPKGKGEGKLEKPG
jgi:hypothetical protein